MSRPLGAVLHYHGLNVNSVGLLEDGDICDVVIPFDVENGVELSLVKLLKLLKVLLVQCPGLAAIKQSENDNRLVDPELSCLTEVFALKDPFREFVKCRMCCSNSVVNVFLGRCNWIKGYYGGTEIDLPAQGGFQ